METGLNRAEPNEDDSAKKKRRIEQGVSFADHDSTGGVITGETGSINKSGQTSALNQSERSKETNASKSNSDNSPYKSDVGTPTRATSPNKPQPKTDIYGRVTTKEPKYPISCPTCGRNITVSRFAAHLEKCLGISGRGSSTKT
jgi:hypothetical protein